MMRKPAITDSGLVFHVEQNRFDVIPRSPWVYRISEEMRRLFEGVGTLANVATPRRGLTTVDNARFIRYWWEIGRQSIGFGYADRKSAQEAALTWYPLVKGGRAKRWYGGEHFIVNWMDDGREIKANIVERYPYLNGKWEWVAKNQEYYFLEGAAYSTVGGDRLRFRWMPQGFICEQASNAIYSDVESWPPRALVGLFNSSLANYIVGMNETINITIDDLFRMPVSEVADTATLEVKVGACIHLRMYEDSLEEAGYSFIAPRPTWTGSDRVTTLIRLQELEAELDRAGYLLVGIRKEDRISIETEVEVDLSIASSEVLDSRKASAGNDSEGSPYDRSQLLTDWISYAVGIVLARFIVGSNSALGSAVYQLQHFATGSLSSPGERDFNEIVGPIDSFEYLDDQGGRHIFPVEIEVQLADLSLEDGIAALGFGHPRDLTSLVDEALRAMLGSNTTDEVISEGAEGDLRKFLGKDFFTKHHIKMYHKRPVYWPIQSAKRSYGFVLFHEKIQKDTLYRLQREFLDPKRNSVRLKLKDLQDQLQGLEGRARKAIEKEIAESQDLAEELDQFARDLEEITAAGYEPEPNWIDDGVILRMAPLWKVIPMWQSEPKKYWERLEKGEYDWSHIAMHYWPDRVKEKCKMKKSYAIAHGLEHIYEGD